MTTRPVVSYLRVSSKKQSKDGLGIDAQREAVARLCRSNGVDHLAEFVEQESGRKSSRRVLRKAIDYAKEQGATLCVARLDRLSRNVAFLSALMESQVDFVCCDIPDATPMTLHVLAAVAQAEADKIRSNTKAALARAKARGTLLGTANPNNKLTNEKCRLGAVRSSQLRREDAVEAYEHLAPFIQELKAQGLSLNAIAQRLNAEKSKKFRTRTGKQFTAMQVSRIIDRLRRQEGQ